jgi:hypothetical protein
VTGSQERFEGSRIPDPGFAGDDGSADTSLTTALASYDAGSADRAQVLAALTRARLLVPVVALLGEVEHDDQGLAREKTSDMAAVLITRPDGQRGLLAFTCTATMRAWDGDARPVPVSAATAALAAVQQEADALVVDLAGPVRFAVEGDDLRGLAAGWQLARVGDRSAWIRPASE